MLARSPALTSSLLLACAAECCAVSTASTGYEPGTGYTWWYKSHIYVAVMLYSTALASSPALATTSALTSRLPASCAYRVSASRSCSNLIRSCRILRTNTTNNTQRSGWLWDVELALQQTQED